MIVILLSMNIILHINRIIRCVYIYTYTYITINMIVNDDHLITSINQYHAQLLTINLDRYTWMCIPPSQWFIIHCFKNYNPIKN